MAYLELLGVWIDGPRDEAVPWNTATPIDLPRGSDVVLGFRLIDSLGQPVDLALAGADRLVLSVRQTFNDAPLLEVTGTKLAEVGAYQFSIASNSTIDFNGRTVYDVWVTRSAAQQQVMAPAYFNVTPRMRNS